MYKIIGIALVVFSTTFLGISKANECVKRIHYLACMQRCLVQLENQIRYTQTPLKEVFLHLSECSDKLISDVFKSAYSVINVGNGKSVNDIWKDVVSKFKNCFNKEDVSLIMSMGDCLCNTDVEGQLKSLELFSHNLQDAVARAEQYYIKNKKMFTGIGFYSGTIISVLFL